MSSRFGFAQHTAFKATLLVLLAAGVAACSGTQPSIENTVAVQPRVSGAQGLDVYAATRSRGGAAPTYYGERTIAILAGPDGWATDGPSCTLSNDLFSAEFVAPAYVRLPDYRENSPSATVQCTHEGQSGSLTLRAENLSALRRQQGAVQPSWGGTGVTISVPLGPRNRQGDFYGYPGTFTVPLS